MGRIGRIGREEAIERGLLLLITLSTKTYGMDYKEIQELLGCGVVSMYRYLNALKAAGVHLLHWQEIGDDGEFHPLIRLESIRGFKLTPCKSTPIGEGMGGLTPTADCTSGRSDPCTPKS